MLKMRAVVPKRSRSMKPEPRGVHKVDFRLSDEDKAKIKRFAAVAEGSPLAFLRVDRHDCLLDTLFKYLRKPLSKKQHQLTKMVFMEDILENFLFQQINLMLI